MGRRWIWQRDGTIVSSDGTEIELTDKHGDWITIKGKSDRRTERLARLVVGLLNAPDEAEESGGGE